MPDPATETNGTCRGDGALQVAFDPSGRHLRHPARSPSGNRVVATAYAGPEGIDSAIERPGAIVLFDAATAAPLRDLTRGPDDSYAGFSPDGRSVIFQRGRGIWTVPVAGGAPRRLIARGAQPTWGR